MDPSGLDAKIPSSHSLELVSSERGSQWKECERRPPNEGQSIRITKMLSGASYAEQWGDFSTSLRQIAPFVERDKG
ncbi:hypothetical protein BCON_0357g00030 [Botryotinia convoluta]|uniref:Uncharacterized protein n=1 Tax=Botryotinia convoluta TaxID=54673 RepID=A0A4Z1HAR6_9HELO|nr:hypothetical protein BCON_0357g00030 [Botryotinia convoluta]